VRVTDPVIAPAMFREGIAVGRTLQLIAAIEDPAIPSVNGSPREASGATRRAGPA